MKRTFDYRHVVGFEESNLLGNVYFTNHFLWQGRCREMFLRQHAPEVIRSFEDGLRLVTLRCSCEYFAEIAPLDDVLIRMSLEGITQNRLTLSFAYVVERDSGELSVARGTQEIACMTVSGQTLVPVPVPAALREALRPYETG